MASLLRDHEDDPSRTDYFGNIMMDAVEPSSSPSEGNSPYRTFIEEQVRGSGRSSPAPGRNGYHTDDDQTSRKQARTYVRDSRESRKMNTLLLLTSERLDKEIRRANEAERKMSDTVALLRSTVEAKVLAQQEATRVGEELRLYKLQYENAQREIFKAQDMINQIEARRQEAEEAAARARSTARKLKEQNLVMLAREEGRQLGYQEGLAQGQRMGYDEATRGPRFATPMQDDYVGQSDEGVEDEPDYVLAEQPSDIRLRPPPFSTPLREQDQSDPISRPGSRAAKIHHDPILRAPSAPVPSLTTTSVDVPFPRHATGPPPPVPASDFAPSMDRKRNRSNSQPYSLRSASSSRPNIPPDNWIPMADENNYIAIPPPHNMTQSPSASPIYANQPLSKPGPIQAPVPRAPVTLNAAAGPSSIRIRDFAFGSRKKQAQTRENLQPPPGATSPSSQTSTRISDYDLLTSPSVDGPPLPPMPDESTMPMYGEEMTEPDAPGPEKTGWKYNPRSWTRRKSEASPRVSGGPRPRPDSIAQSPTSTPNPPKSHSSHDQRRRADTQSSTSSSSSSSGSSTTLDRVKQDPRRDAEGGSRTPLGWFFKKRYRDKQSSSSGTSAVVPDITVESPSNSSHAQTETPPGATQPHLLSPEYREAPLPQPERQVSSSTHQKSQQSKLPPLAELRDLISPGAASSGDLPLGFVPTAQQQQPEQQRPRPTEPSRSRSASRNRKEQKGYEAAPLPPGVTYPDPPPSPAKFKGGSRTKSRPRSYTVDSGGGIDRDPGLFSYALAARGIRA